MKNTSKKIKKVILAVLTIITAYMILSHSVTRAARNGDYEYTITGNHAIITQYYGSDEILEIPTTLNGYVVKSIGKQAFKNAQTLKTVKIPDSVVNIEDAAFYYCINLENIIMPDNVASIGSGAFYNCTSLREITIPKNVTSIKYCTFDICKSLSKVLMQNGVETIEVAAFGNAIINDITIPESVKKIRVGAFSSCKKLTEVTFLSEIPPEVEVDAFYECSNLSIIYVPSGSKVAYESVEQLSSYTIKELGYEYSIEGNNATITQYYGSDETLEIPAILDGYVVKSIGNQAFKNVKTLKNVKIPESVVSIEDAAFYYCINLENVILPDNVASIGSGAFYNCTSLKEITIPKNVTSIKYCTFDICKSLSKVLMQNGVETIEVAAFGNAIINDVTIPESVKKIRVGAFSSCKYLTEVTFLSKSPPELEVDAFYECSNLSTIYVPSGSKAAYQNIPQLVGYTVLEVATPTQPPTPTPPSPDRYEPNNTSSTATNNLKGKVVSANIHEANNTDWYKFEVLSNDVGEPFSFILTDIPSNCDYDLSVRDANLTEYISSKTRGNASEEKTYKFSKAGTYYVNIQPYSGCSNYNYKLYFGRTYLERTTGWKSTGLSFKFPNKVVNDIHYVPSNTGWCSYNLTNDSSIPNGSIVTFLELDVTSTGTYSGFYKQIQSESGALMEQSGAIDRFKLTSDSIFVKQKWQINGFVNYASSFTWNPMINIGYKFPVSISTMKYV